MRTVLILSLLLVTFFPCLVLSECSKINIRYEIRSLPKDRLARYINAVLALKEAPSGGGPSVYDILVNIHLSNVAYAHGVPAFLPWHRQYLMKYEAALQSIDPTVTLPYWDWTLDSQSPETSILFTENYFGGNGGSDGCISDGPFASWKNFYPSPNCLRRKFSAGNGKIGSFYAPEGVQLMIDRATTFDGLRTTIEGSPHGIVHIGIGGDMSTMASPNDPLFWAHHGMVDKIWADWQKLDRSFLLDYGGPKAASTDILTPFGSRVSDMLNTTADGLCYDYAENWEIPPELPSTALEAIVTVSKSVKSTTTTTTTKVSSTASSDPTVTSHSDVVDASSQPTETSEPIVDGTVIPTTDKSSDASQSVWSFFRSISVTRYQKIRTPLASRRFIWTKETSLSGGQTVLSSTTDTHTTHDMDMDMDMTTSDPADQPDFDYRHMGYQAPASDDREDTHNLRIPKPMPYAWLRAMKMDIGVARATEMALAQMTDELNKLADYVSPAALVNTGGGSTASTTTVPLTKKLRRRHHIEL